LKTKKDLKNDMTESQILQKELYKRRLMAMYNKNIIFFKDLARETGLNKVWITYLMLGIKRSKEKEEKIAAVLGTSREYLFGRNKKEAA
jgi:cyanate lyase